MEPTSSMEFILPKESDTISTTSWCDSDAEHIDENNILQEDQEEREENDKEEQKEEEMGEKGQQNEKPEQKRKEEHELQESNIRAQTPTALMSSATLGQTPQEGPSDSGLTREQKMSILKRLMKEVTLEDTLAKYRGFTGPTKKSTSLLEGDSSKSLLSSASPYNLGMEGDILFLADRQYMAKLEAQLEKQYQLEMDKKEEERADLERQRMRRLMVEGIIGPEDLKEDGYMKSRNHNSRSRRGTIHGNKKTTPQLAAKNSRAHAQSAVSSSAHANRKGTPNKPHTPRYNGSSFNGDTQISRMSREEEEEEGRPREERRLHFQRCFLHDEEGCNCDSQRPVRKQAFIKRYEDPIITQLKEEEITVDQMYDLADTILPQDRPKPYLDAPKSGKKKLTPAQERKRREMALAGVPRR